MDGAASCRLLQRGMAGNWSHGGATELRENNCRPYLAALPPNMGRWPCGPTKVHRPPDLERCPAKIPHREQDGGKGSRAEPGTGTCRSRQLRAGPTRCRFAVRAGPKTKTPRPQERCKAARDRARPQPRSAFHSHPSCMRTRKKAGTGEGSCPIARQNSSIAPGTVCTMRLARCAGSAL